MHCLRLLKFVLFIFSFVSVSGDTLYQRNVINKFNRDDNTDSGYDYDGVYEIQLSNKNNLRDSIKEGFILNFDKEKDYNNFFRGSVLQGIINEHYKLPIVYVRRINDNDKWFSITQDDLQMTARNISFHEVSVDELMYFALDNSIIEGKVIYDTKYKLSIPAVVTLCGIKKSIPFTRAQLHRYYDALDDIPLVYDFTVKQNKFKDDKGMSVTNFSMDYAHNCNSKQIAVQRPELLLNGYLTDYIVQKQMMVIWIDDACNQNTDENNVFTDVLDYFWRSNLVFGSFPGNELILSSCTSLKSQVNSTQVWINAAKSSSMSFFDTLLPPRSSFRQKKPNYQKYIPNKTYIAVISQEGDDLREYSSQLLNLLEKRVENCAEHEYSFNRCNIPLSWPISSRLLDEAPHVLRSLYSKAELTQRDSFLLGANGYGGPLDILESNDNKTLIKKTENIALKLDINSYYLHSDFSSNNKINSLDKKELIRLYTSAKVIKGLFYPSPLASFKEDIEEMKIPIIPEIYNWIKSDEVIAVAKSLNAMEPGSVGFISFDLNVPLENLEKLQSCISENVTLVGYRELIDIANQKNRSAFSYFDMIDLKNINHLISFIFLILILIVWCHLRFDTFLRKRIAGDNTFDDNDIKIQVRRSKNGSINEKLLLKNEE